MLSVGIGCFHPDGVVGIMGNVNTIILRGCPDDNVLTQCKHLFTDKCNYNCKTNMDENNNEKAEQIDVDFGDTCYFDVSSIVQRVLRLPGDLVDNQMKVTPTVGSVLLLDFIVRLFQVR